MLAVFESPTSLVAYLNRRDGDVDVKNDLLTTLVAMVQAREEGPLVSALLWLGLWPALGAIRRRRLRSFETEDELTAALALAFTSLVARVDLRRTR
ncbi:sigma-70 family RNA polymerase sigma factor, partial [Corallococcus sp. M34]|nr:sigma-70 family RNA polymerase sigma factor [Citreicoccus inhibens]